MDQKEYLRAVEDFLVKLGWDRIEAKAAAVESSAAGQPILETLCFQHVAEHVLAPIHKSEWIQNRASDSDGEPAAVIKRLLDAGASAEDLAIFARLMQREYLANVGCLLDGSGIYGTPEVPFENFRVFCVDDSERPTAAITDLHESLGFSDMETEMKLSRAADRTSK